MVEIIRASAKPPRPPVHPIELAPQEQALLYLIRVKDDLVSAFDALRPKLIFRHSISEYRQMIEKLRGEVYLEDLLKGLGARGPVRLTY